jgi:hypothetical protein
VHAQALLERHGEQRAPERVIRLVLLQLVLGGERQALEVRQRADLLRPDAGGVELLAIERAVVVSVRDLCAQPLLLQARQRLARGGLDLGLEAARGHAPLMVCAAARTALTMPW